MISKVNSTINSSNILNAINALKQLRKKNLIITLKSAYLTKIMRT